MILDKNNNQEHELYVKALKSLDAHNMVSEYRKVPSTPEERAFAHDTHNACSTSLFGLNIDDERWNTIFHACKEEDAINEVD